MAATQTLATVDPRVEPLFRPIRIGGVELANRYVLGPVAAHQCTPDGRPTDETVAFFERRAAGGIGLAIVGSSTSTNWGWDGTISSKYMLRFDRDDYVEDLRRIAAATHRHGVPVFAQINTAMGRMGKPGPHHIAASPINVVISEQSLKGILPIPGGIRTPVPREATLEEIAYLEAETVASALRMRSADFDGVEIGAHMSYFVASFLSARTNLRTDAYGGSPQNRARILVNIIQGIRAAAGPDFPIGVRLSAAEHTAGGQGCEDYAEIAALAEAAGANYFALTSGAYESLERSVAGDASLLTLGEVDAFRRRVQAPLLVHGVHDPDQAAAAVAAGRIDLIMLVRPLLADPLLPQKIRGGVRQTIRACNGDNQCLKRLMTGLPIRCPVNTELGFEAESPRGLRAAVLWLRGRWESLVLQLTASPWFMRLAAKGAAMRSQSH